MLQEAFGPPVEHTGTIELTFAFSKEALLLYLAYGGLDGIGNDLKGISSVIRRIGTRWKISMPVSSFAWMLLLKSLL